MGSNIPDIALFQTTIEKTDLTIAFKFRPVGKDLILLLHGLGCSMATFKHAFTYPALKKYSLLSLDFPGFGHSSKPDQFPYSLKSHAQCIEKLISIYPGYRLHIVGHSMGGAIGLLLSDAILKSAISYANVEGNLIKEDCSMISRETIAHPFKKFTEKTFKKLVNPICNTEYISFDIENASPVAFYNSAKSLVHFSDTGRLFTIFNDLKCRKIYFYGEKNTGMDILGRLDAIETEMISGSGHFMMNENPDEFYHKLNLFLEQAHLK